MTLQQLEYLVALDTHRHFAAAAEACFVTQPTLSMQLQKLEEELGFNLFDRTKQPVVPTEVGTVLIEQARQVLRESHRFMETAKELKGDMEGTLRLGVIPTIGPYLLPNILPSFLEKYPAVKVVLEEMTTSQCLEKLRNDQIDAAILAIPLPEPGFEEEVLYYEPFVAYISQKHPLSGRGDVTVDDLRSPGLWLMSEGHCMRNQVLSLCDVKPVGAALSLQFVAGSMETLRLMVDQGTGFTLLPQLALSPMNDEQKAQVHSLEGGTLVREIGLVSLKNRVKKALLNRFRKHVVSHPYIQELTHKPETSQVVPI